MHRHSHSLYFGLKVQWSLDRLFGAKDILFGQGCLYFTLARLSTVQSQSFARPAKYDSWVGQIEDQD